MATATTTAAAATTTAFAVDGFGALARLVVVVVFAVQIGVVLVVAVDDLVVLVFVLMVEGAVVETVVQVGGRDVVTTGTKSSLVEVRSMACSPWARLSSIWMTTLRPRWSSRRCR